ncbi:MAG TPA: YdcF family protein [Beijerinckiaceae bacterium]|nr:YdcF family protein [Beijerinckiaceae bacterium]
MSGPDAIEVVPTGWEWQTNAAPAVLPRPRRFVKYALAACALGVVAFAMAMLGGFYAFVSSIDRYERNPTARTDAIVALTGGAQRVGDAIDLLAKGYAGRLLISGVNERTGRDEIARLNPGQRRLLDCCVDLDYRARNTIGNAIETRRWMRDHGFRSLIVVTSNYHMPRTLTELDHVLPGVRKVPYPVVTGSVDLDGWWREPGTAKLLAYEYAKFLAVWFRTRIEKDPERSPAATLMGGGRPVKAPSESLRKG